MATTIFQQYWKEMPQKARDEWFKRRVLRLVRFLNARRDGLFREAIDDAKDVVQDTLVRLLSPLRPVDASEPVCGIPTGEYAQRDCDTTPESYYRRCEAITVKALLRKRLREAARTYRIDADWQHDSHAHGDRYAGGYDLISRLRHVLSDDPTTAEEVVARKQLIATAFAVVSNLVGQSRLRGVSKEYAQRLPEFLRFDIHGTLVSSLDTGEIAAKLRTTTQNVRTARFRVLRQLIRQGVVRQDLFRDEAFARPPMNSRH